VIYLASWHLGYHMLKVKPVPEEPFNIKAHPHPRVSIVIYLASWHLGYHMLKVKPVPEEPFNIKAHPHPRVSIVIYLASWHLGSYRGMNLGRANLRPRVYSRTSSLFRRMQQRYIRGTRSFKSCLHVHENRRVEHGERPCLNVRTLKNDRADGNFALRSPVRTSAANPPMIV